MRQVDRRTVLLGSAAMLVAACSGKGSEGGSTPSPKGPNIVKPKTGNLVTAEDTAALRDRLNAAMKSGDVKQLVAVVDPDAFDLDDFEKRWRRRMDNFERLGFIDGEWYVGSPGGRTRNAAGGKVEYSGDLVFAHTVKGCDGQQVVETMRADFRKVSEDAPLELLRVGETDEFFDPSFWDVAEIDAIETKHTWIAFRTSDAKQAKAHASRIESGAARAFDFMPRPKGVDKVFYALTWPAIDGKLWGGVAVGDALAHAYYHPFLDPDELANGQKKLADRTGLPVATGRVGLHAAALAQPDLEGTACHEGVHVLADQWGTGGDAPTWVVEGLAEWSRAESDLLAREGGRIRSTFRQFESVAVKGYREFHNSPQEYAYYQCAAAVYAYLDDTGGRDAVLEVAQSFYGSDSRAEGAKKLGRSEQDLLAATRKWLRA